MNKDLKNKHKKENFKVLLFIFLILLILLKNISIKRGLYKTKTSALINADVNGSLNILRKYLKVSSDQIISVGSRGFVTNPLVVNI